jgi:hypothetical protein
MSRFQNRKRLRPLFEPFYEPLLRIYIDTIGTVIGMVMIILGTATRIVTNKFTNSHRSLVDQGCPALDGEIYSWTLNAGNYLIIFGLINFAMSGLIPKVFQTLHLRDEAICCGQLFMSKFGKFVTFAVSLTLMLFNIYGTLIYREAKKEGVQHEDQWPLNKVKTFCEKPLWILFQVLNFGLYACFGLVIPVATFIVIKKMRNSYTAADFKTLDKLDFGPEVSEMATVLGLIESKKDKDKKKKHLKRNIPRKSKHLKKKKQKKFQV